MDPSEQMLIEWQQRFAHFLDNGALDDLVALFTPDGVFDRASTPLCGQKTIREAMRNRPTFTTRHLLTNFLFSDVTADSAQGTVGSIVFHGPVPEEGLPVPFATENGRVVEFHDRYVRFEAGWRLGSRVVRPILQPAIWP